MSDTAIETPSDAVPVLETAHPATDISEDAVVELAVLTESSVEAIPAPVESAPVSAPEPEAVAAAIPRRAINLAELDSRYYRLPLSILEVP